MQRLSERFSASLPTGVLVLLAGGAFGNAVIATAQSSRHVRPDERHDLVSVTPLRNASVKRSGAHRGRGVSTWNN